MRESTDTISKMNSLLVKLNALKDEVENVFTDDGEVEDEIVGVEVSLGDAISALTATIKLAETDSEDSDEDEE